MDVSDARKLKALKDENAKLKKLLTEAMPDNAILKNIASKNVWSAPPCYDFGRSDKHSLLKCIRPLAREVARLA